jgi:hypothetical protein
MVVEEALHTGFSATIAGWQHRIAPATSLLTSLATWQHLESSRQRIKIGGGGIVVSLLEWSKFTWRRIHIRYL